MRKSRVFIAAITMLAVTFGAWAAGQDQRGRWPKGPCRCPSSSSSTRTTSFPRTMTGSQGVIEMLGIVIDSIPAPQDVRDERIATMMASGDLQDVVNIFEPSLANIYGAEGAFLKMDPLIEQYGPDMTELLDKSLTAAYRDAAGDLYGAIGMHYGGGAIGCGQSMNYGADHHGGTDDRRAGYRRWMDGRVARFQRPERGTRRRPERLVELWERSCRRSPRRSD